MNGETRTELFCYSLELKATLQQLLDFVRHNSKQHLRFFIQVSVNGFHRPLNYSVFNCCGQCLWCSWLIGRHTFQNYKAVCNRKCSYQKNLNVHDKVLKFWYVLVCVLSIVLSFLCTVTRLNSVWSDKCIAIQVFTLHMQWVCSILCQNQSNACAFRVNYTVPFVQLCQRRLHVMNLTQWIYFAENAALRLAALHHFGGHTSPLDTRWNDEHIILKTLRLTPTIYFDNEWYLCQCCL